MIKKKYEINTRTNSLKYVNTVLKLCYHLVIDKIYIRTCTVFKILEERIDPNCDGFFVSMPQDGSCCVRINTVRVDNAISINGL